MIIYFKNKEYDTEPKGISHILTNEEIEKIKNCKQYIEWFKDGRGLTKIYEPIIGPDGRNDTIEGLIVLFIDITSGVVLKRGKKMYDSGLYIDYWTDYNNINCWKPYPYESQIFKELGLI